MSGVLEYDSNNSGGSWWLKDKDWHALEAAGWTVDWVKPGDMFVREDGRYLGALATGAEKHVPSPAEGVAEWERITGQSASDEGCNCCGRPHNFTFKDAETGKISYLDHTYAAVRSEWS